MTRGRCTPVRPLGWKFPCPIPTVVSPAKLIKYPQTFHKSCPPFLQGSKMSQFLGQISTPVVFKPPYFRTGALYRKTKTNLSRTDDRPTTTPKLGWVGSPQLPETLAQWVHQKVKWKISYKSSIPAAQAEYSATNVMPPVGAMAAVKSLPCHISQFAPYISQGGGKN